MILTDKLQLSEDPAGTLKAVLSRHQFTRIGVLVDSNTKDHCYAVVGRSLPDHKIIEVPAGEQYKTLNTCEKIWGKMTELGLDRHSVLIILGGGVLGDMGGFCASTYKRGIAFMLIPTTLLAQVDASIGGKLGIDFDSYKNHIGLFNEPASTIVATTFLKTLNHHEIKSGFAEILKHCLSSDAMMWEEIKSKNIAQQDWNKLVQHSINFKSAVVQKDPKESGIRKILNVGHTIGHAVESHFLKGNQPLSHGEAVAIGLITEAHIAFQKKRLTKDSLGQIAGFLAAIYGTFKLPDLASLLPAILQDKKNKGNEIRMALLDGIGKADWDIAVTENEIDQSLLYYQSL